MSAARNAEHQALIARVAALGETIQSHFETDELRAELTALGFRTINDLGPAEVAARFFPQGTLPISRTGAHIVHAATFAHRALR
jgi:hypothetical protein